MANTKRMNLSPGVPPRLFTQQSRDYSIPEEQWSPWKQVPATLEALAAVDPKYGLYTESLGSEGDLYSTYDIGVIDRAKRVLSQPETTTPEWIAKNFPSLASLPKSTLQAMSQDWRNAYGSMVGLLAPSSSPSGYTRAVTREEGGQPVISYGGPTEMYASAAPYVEYSPEYGLVVPKEGIRPAEQRSLGIGALIPALIGGAALGPLSALIGPGVLGAAGAGAITGGLSSALAGGNVMKGVLTGGLTGGIGAAASPALAQAINATGITGTAADVLQNAALSAGKAAMVGGDPLKAALTAAVGSGVGGTLAKMDVLKELDPSLAKAVTAAASGAAKAAISGADPVKSALASIADIGMSAITNAVTPTALAPSVEKPSATPEPVPFSYDEAPTQAIPDKATPTESWIDQGFLVNEATPSIESLLDELGQQESSQADMASSLLGYDPRIVDAMAQSEAEQQAMQQSLAGETGRVAPVASRVVGTTPSPMSVAQAAPAAGGQMDLGSLLAILGMTQQQQKAPEPIPTVGEIKPYEFGSDLLSGVYSQPKQNMYSSNDELLKMMRGA